jgi:hypothetical protein
MSVAVISCEYLSPEVQDVSCVEGHVILNCLQRSLLSVTKLVALLRVSSTICVSTCLPPAVSMPCKEARTTSFGACR